VKAKEPPGHYCRTAPFHDLPHMGARALSILIILLTGVFPMISCKAARPDDRDGVPPEKAVVVLAKYAWGCLTEQSVIRDITRIEMPTGEQIAEVFGAEDHEDLVVRQELYLFFPAKEVNGLPGFFIVRLHAGNMNPPIRGRLVVTNARLLKGDGPVVELLVKPVKARIDASLHYSRHIDPVAVPVSCPGFEPSRTHRLKLLRAYPFKAGPKAAIQQANENSERITLAIGAHHLAEAKQIDQCEALLDRLDREFSVSGETSFFWDGIRMTPAAIRQSMGAITAATGQRYGISIVTLGRKRPEVMWENRANLAPRIMQPITLKEKNGRLTAGEIRIGIEAE